MWSFTTKFHASNNNVCQSENNADTLIGENLKWDGNNQPSNFWLAFCNLGAISFEIIKTLQPKYFTFLEKLAFCSSVSLIGLLPHQKGGEMKSWKRPVDGPDNVKKKKSASFQI